MSVGSFAPFYFIDAALYAVLLIAALQRLVRRLVTDGCPTPSRRSAFTVVLVYIALACYGLVRGIVLLMTGLDRVPNDQGLSECMFDMIPALFFCIVQTLLIAKWAGHVNDVSMVLFHRPFTYYVAIVASSGVVVGAVAIECIAVVIGLVSSAVNVSASTWTTLVNASCGVAYIYNGIVFAALGVHLRSKWHPVTSHDRSACRRVLAIAIVFGGVTVARGIPLLFFAENGHDHIVYSVWGAPTVILVEWIAIAVSIFGLTNVSGSSASVESGSVASATSEPMIGSARSHGPSSRSAVGSGGRGGMFPWRSPAVANPSATPPGSQLEPITSYTEGTGVAIEAAYGVDDLPRSTASLAVNDACE